MMVSANRNASTRKYHLAKSFGAVLIICGLWFWLGVSPTMAQTQPEGDCSIPQACPTVTSQRQYTSDLVTPLWPTTHVLHPTRPLNGEIYRAQIETAHLLWRGNQLWLGVLILLDHAEDQFDQVTEQVIIAAIPFYGGLLMICSLIALVLAALNRFGFWLWEDGKRPWISEGQVLVISVLACAYLATPMLYIQLVSDFYQFTQQGGAALARTAGLTDAISSENLPHHQPTQNEANDLLMLYVWSHFQISAETLWEENQLPKGLRDDVDGCCFRYAQDDLGYELLPRENKFTKEN